MSSVRLVNVPALYCLQTPTPVVRRAHMISVKREQPQQSLLLLRAPSAKKEKLRGTLLSLSGPKGPRRP